MVVHREEEGREPARPGLVLIVALVALAVVGSSFSLTGSRFGAGWTATPAEPRSICPSTSALFCLSANATGWREDLIVTSPNLTVLEGAPAPLFAQFPNGTSGSSFHWRFGDGSAAVTASGRTTHLYATPGVYLVLVRATDKFGVVHDNNRSAFEFSVASSVVGDPQGTRAVLTGSVTSNSSTMVQPAAILRPGSQVSLAVRILETPTDPSSVLGGPTFSVSANAGAHAMLAALMLSLTGPSTVTVRFDYTTPFNLYVVTFALPSTTAVSGHAVRTWSNFSFSVDVGPAPGGLGAPVALSPHPGLLNVYEYAPGGASTFDPAIDYETFGAEVLRNVYQTLVTTNGSAVGGAAADFVPYLATCVPGSPLCTHLYGTSLVNGSAVTFVINNRSAFFDPATRASWGVWPTDVQFSFVRTLAFSTLPCFGCDVGWVVAQTLLPLGNRSWDGGIHAAANNTPQNIYRAVTVNDSSDCPAAALAVGQHGCVTFHLHGSSPSSARIFLEAISGPDGGSIVSCGWYSAAPMSAGVPYWTQGNVSGTGDAPCGGPGSSGFGVGPAHLSPTAWDSYERTGGNFTFAAVGSGAYYLSSVQPAFSYDLVANPAFAPDPYCRFQGCPAAALIRHVDVTWEATLAPGIAALQNGTADVVAINPGNASALVDAVEAGTATVRSVPSLEDWFAPLNLAYNLTTADALAGRNLSAPSTILTDLNLRQFLIHAFDYANFMAAQNPAGVPFRFAEAGSIPSFLGTATPTGIDWPGGAPVANASVVGSAGWWWNRTAHDAAAGKACRSAHPCSFLVAYTNGDTVARASLARWAAFVRNASGGAVSPVVRNISFATWVINSLYSGPGQDGLTITSFGAWAPDYPDPGDYVAPTYLPDAQYTVGTALAEALNPLNTTSCSTSVSGWAFRVSPIPLGCQGAAYDAMVTAFFAAEKGPIGPKVDALYAEGESIANELGLYLPLGQSNAVTLLAPWVDPSSANPNPSTAFSQDWSAYLYTPLVGSTLGVQGPVAFPAPVAHGSRLTIAAAGTGGAGGYSYSWSGLPTGCTPTNDSTIVCRPTTAGTYAINVTVTDAAGSTVTSANLLLTVTQPSPPGERRQSAARRPHPTRR